MPIYEYIHPETGETIEVAQGMTDKHIFVDDQGVEWRRKFNAPNATIDNEFSADMTEKQFARVTEGKNYTLGQMWDKSAELSQKRAQKSGGEDPVLDKAYKSYSKDRRGMKHRTQQQKEIKKKLKDL